jgi:hypothetical protein
MGNHSLAPILYVRIKQSLRLSGEIAELHSRMVQKAAPPLLARRAIHHPRPENDAVGRQDSFAEGQAKVAATAGT